MEPRQNLKINWSDKILAECIGEEPPPCQAACTHCLHTIAECRPQIKTRSLYEVILEMGLPPEFKPGTPGVFNIHDACGARQAPDLQEAVAAW